MVAPLNTEFEDFATVTAVVPAPEFHPATVPSSVTKRKVAGLPLGSPKSGVPLKTAPVGVPAEPAFAPGIVTTSESGAPVLPLYSVDFPVPLSAAHQGLPELRASPQGFTRLVSWVNAA